MSSLAIPEQFNLADHLLDARVREGLGEQVAVRCPEADYSYRQVQIQANRYAGLLRRAGVEEEQRVVLALPDGLDLVAALFGVLKIGAVALILNPHLQPGEAVEHLRRSRARALITDRAGGELWGGLPSDYLKARFSADGPAPHCRDGAEGLQAESDDFRNALTHRDDPALWIFSGGTTGHPKAAVQSHRSFANTAELYGRNWLGLTAQDVTLSVPKLFFGYATGSNLFFPFLVGASCCLFPDKATPETIFAQLKRHRPTILINVPTVVARMLERADDHDLSHLRLTTSAGEALPPSLGQAWQKRFGHELLDGLGTAEMWHIFLSNQPGRARPGTLGQPVPGFTIKVADDDGVAVAPGQIGRLWVKGHSRALGYWQNQEESAAAFQGEWYRSADLVYQDSDGFYIHCGRQDELLKVSGRWVAPQEVEDCLLQHPQVRECAVIGVSREGLVRPVAYVVADQSGVEEELKAFCLERLDAYKHPREIYLVADLPRTHLGKIDRGRLRRS